MARNIIWCLIRNIFQRHHSPGIKVLPGIITRFKHAERGYDSSPQQGALNIDYHEVKTYQQFLDETNIGLGRAALTLMKTLNVTRENAVNAVIIWKAFGSLSKQAIIENNNLLREAGAEKSTLRQNMYALADTTSHVKSKIHSIQSTRLDINSAIPLFQLSARKMANFAIITKTDKIIIPDYNNRIEYLVNKFNCDRYDFCLTLCHNIHMLHQSIEKIVAITEYLLDVGVIGEHLMNDLIVYKYSLRTIKQRMKRAVEAGISPLKPWVVRCSIDVFEKTEARNLSRETVLKSAKSTEEYISQVLNCDIESVNALVKRDPLLTSINIAKLAKILQILRSYRYTISDIFRSPRSLHCSEEAITRKYEKWIQHGLGHPPLSVISGSQKYYEERLIIAERQVKSSICSTTL